MTGASALAPDEPLRWWRLVGGVAVVAVLVFVGVAVLGAVTAQRTAEREAVNDALNITDVLSQSVLQPALDDDLLADDASDPTTTSAARVARAKLDTIVRQRLLSPELVRVKLWTPQGRIVYSDEPRLINEVFPLDTEELDALRNPSTKAEVSDLDKPENRFERGDGDKLLEVYRPVWTPDHQQLLFETYSRYDAVTARSGQLWRGFGGITLTSMLLLLVAQAPLTWALVARIRKAQAEREKWLAQAVSASDDERKRIAATLHDGAVQELAASAFLVAGAADRARTGGNLATVQQLELAAESVRSSIGGLRSLLVDIYPPTLRAAGITAALTDLAAPMRSRGIEVGLAIPEPADLLPATESLIFRVAQEALRNIDQHADASAVEVRLTIPGSDAEPAVLEISDDGTGFDPEAVLSEPAEGHFGLRLMADQAAAAGATLRVASAPGHGTRWRLEVPR